MQIVYVGDKPATRGRRFFALAGMTAKVAGGYASSRLKSVFQSAQRASESRSLRHRLNGQLITETLGQLKGAVMKVGQMASLAHDMLPPEIASALQRLQRGAPPVPFDVIAAQIESEFGSPPARLFHWFDEAPFAAASIGQVHRARTDDGREVVVKVQYPGVDAALDSDLVQLKLALRASGLARVDRKSLNALFAELKKHLYEELDYCNEADNVRLFFDLYRDNPLVVVPEVVGTRSSQRVLTLSFEPGDDLNALDEAGYDQALKDRIGRSLFAMLAEQIFEVGVVHADPNPANFAFRPDGTIVMYDFGCVKRLDAAVIDAYRDLIRCAFAEDYAGVDESLMRMGARDPNRPPMTREYYQQWRNIFIKPFLDVPFDYAKSTMHTEVIELIPAFLLKHARSFKPAAELGYLDRVVIGHYHNLRKLGARGRYRQLLQPYLDRS